jgi:hypothetical protein
LFLFALRLVVSFLSLALKKFWAHHLVVFGMRLLAFAVAVSDREAERKVDYYETRIFIIIMCTTEKSKCLYKQYMTMVLTYVPSMGTWVIASTFFHVTHHHPVLSVRLRCSLFVWTARISSIIAVE